MLDARPSIRALLDDLGFGVGIGVVAARFHNAVAQATAQACVVAAGRHGVDTVVLSGGVFQNRRLLEATLRALVDSGLRVLVPELLPPNDGGISYGQAAVAAARLANESPER
jgi:hydrogenase maturation protein HypF